MVPEGGSCIVICSSSYRISKIAGTGLSSQTAEEDIKRFLFCKRKQIKPGLRSVTGLDLAVIGVSLRVTADCKSSCYNW